MALYYVATTASGSTITGTKASGASSSQSGVAFGATGLLAADCYPNIGAVLSGNTIAAGDTIYCSDLHSIDYAATTTFTGPTGFPSYIVSVDDTSAGVYKTGAEEKATGNSDLTLSKVWQIEGMVFEAGDDFLMSQ